MNVNKKTLSLAVATTIAVFAAAFGFVFMHVYWKLDFGLPASPWAEILVQLIIFAIMIIPVYALAKLTIDELFA